MKKQNFIQKFIQKVKEFIKITKTTGSFWFIGETNLEDYEK